MCYTCRTGRRCAAARQGRKQFPNLLVVDTQPELQLTVCRAQASARSVAGVVWCPVHSPWSLPLECQCDVAAQGNRTPFASWVVWGRPSGPTCAGLVASGALARGAWAGNLKEREGFAGQALAAPGGLWGRPPVSPGPRLAERSVEVSESSGLGRMLRLLGRLGASPCTSTVGTCALERSGRGPTRDSSRLVQPRCLHRCLPPAQPRRRQRSLGRVRGAGCPG
jgi:hypothetical protein